LEAFDVQGGERMGLLGPYSAQQLKVHSRLSTHLDFLLSIDLSVVVTESVRDRCLESWIAIRTLILSELVPVTHSQIRKLIVATNITLKTLGFLDAGMTQEIRVRNMRQRRDCWSDATEMLKVVFTTLLPEIKTAFDLVEIAYSQDWANSIEEKVERAQFFGVLTETRYPISNYVNSEVLARFLADTKRNEVPIDILPVITNQTTPVQFAARLYNLFLQYRAIWVNRPHVPRPANFGMAMISWMIISVLPVESGFMRSWNPMNKQLILQYAGNMLFDIHALIMNALTFGLKFEDKMHFRFMFSILPDTLIEIIKEIRRSGANRQFSFYSYMLAHVSQAQKPLDYHMKILEHWKDGFRDYSMQVFYQNMPSYQEKFLKMNLGREGMPAKTINEMKGLLTDLEKNKKEMLFFYATRDAAGGLHEKWQKIRVVK
jgi:tRNA C32,U32 (ribose-2'-O)-methylase TrmJ